MWSLHWRAPGGAYNNLSLCRHCGGQKDIKYADENGNGCDGFDDGLSVFEWFHAIALTARLVPQAWKCTSHLVWSSARRRRMWVRGSRRRWKLRKWRKGEDRIWEGGRLCDEKSRTMLMMMRETVMKTKDTKSTFQNGCGVGVCTALCNLASLKIQSYQWPRAKRDKIQIRHLSIQNLVLRDVARVAKCEIFYVTRRRLCRPYGRCNKGSLERDGTVGLAMQLFRCLEETLKSDA